MDTQLTVTILLSLIKYVSGLKCMECLHLEHTYVQSNGSDHIYHILDGYRNPQCLSKNPLQYSNPSQQSLVRETVCTGVLNQPNTVQKCGYMSGEVNSFITSVQRAVKFTFYERNCFQVPKTMEDRCYTRKRLAEDMNYVFHRLYSLFGGFKVDSFDGSLCLCSSNLCDAVSGVYQTKCSFVTLIIHVILCCCFLKNRFG
ncbi:hypothetical protein CHS0354_030376 [Potamilus streckersoni]|uniref:Protein quiver n=1 Tax=Potamilus streckersoni TaxID=2493646 RepID=A0AAE0T481_9BIVA|nr:hypothetical protein CHS0354_030376 [Potamilus streckersoni]